MPEQNSEKIAYYWHDTFQEILELCLDAKRGTTEFDQGYHLGLQSVMNIIEQQATAFDLELNLSDEQRRRLSTWRER